MGRLHPPHAQAHGGDAPTPPGGRMGAGGGQVLLGASAKAPDTCWAGERSATGCRGASCFASVLFVGRFWRDARRMGLLFWIDDDNLRLTCFKGSP